MGTEFQIEKMKKFWRQHGGGGCRTIKVYLIPLNSTYVTWFRRGLGGGSSVVEPSIYKAMSLLPSTKKKLIR
jgi:hypothetical protein